MSCAMLDEDHKSPTSYKLICVGKEEKVVGLHLIGDGSDEMLQGCKSRDLSLDDLTLTALHIL
jgi:pyruvate/2-oxoglutarate dehydrogenase complex dihydrolipoamide dehydrogenase (E3) component